MKRTILLVLTLFTTLSVTSCGDNRQAGTQPSHEPPQMQQAQSVQQRTQQAAAQISQTQQELAQMSQTTAQTQSEQEKSDIKSEAGTMNIKVGDTVLTAALEDNSSAEGLKNLLANGPLTINMSDYANMEKVGPIRTNLPRNDQNTVTSAGDLILYLGSSFVIYYDTNEWNFTRLGRINNVNQEELKRLLGDGNVTVTLSLE